MLLGDERFRFQSFLALLLMFSAVSAILIGLAEISRFISGHLPLPLYGGTFLSGMYIILTYITASDRKIVRFMATGGSEMILAMLLVAMLASTIVFGLLCRELFQFMDSGFAGTDTGSTGLRWVAFGFDNLFEALFLDAPNIYGLRLADISASAFSTQSFVLLFRTAANLLIIRSILRYWGFLRNFLFAERLIRR